MPMRVVCPNCKKALTLAGDIRGRSVRCNQCQQVFKAGTAGSPAPQPPTAAPTPAAPAATAPPQGRLSEGGDASKIAAIQKQKPPIQASQGGQSAPSDESQHAEPSDRKITRRSAPPGTPWALLIGVALACFLLGGAAGYFVAQLSSKPAPTLSGPLALAVKNDGLAKDNAPVAAETKSPTATPRYAAENVSPPMAEPKTALSEANKLAPAAQTPKQAAIPPAAPANAIPAKTEPVVKAKPAAAATPEPKEANGPFTLPSAPLGWVMTPDNVTLIVSIASRAELIYFDTVAEKEVKHVSLDFKPAALALRGKELVVVQKGASVLHVLDADSGKQNKEIRVPGEPLERVVCHPARAVAYVSNSSKEVYAVDLVRGTAAKTEAVGRFLAIDPRGEFLYTGTQDPIREQLMIRGGPGNARVSLQKTGRHATMMKYDLKGSGLTLAAVNGNASINGTTLVISPDGTRIALPGAGGWESNSARTRSYSVAIWNTKDMETMLGQVELGIFPHNIAFHPILNLGAVDKGNDTIMVFHGKSLAEVKSYKIPGGRSGSGVGTPLLLTFGGKGGKIIYAGGSPPGQRRQAGQADQAPVLLHILPMELSADERVALEKANANPPAIPAPVADAEPAKTDTVAQTPSAAPAAPESKEAGGGPFTLPSAPLGWVMTPDNVTLIVCIASRAELIYFDTVAEKEVKHVSLDFQPAAMALRGKELVVVQKGASVLHVLDVDSGKQRKEIRIPSEPLEQIVCHPARALAYVSSSNKEVHVINLTRGSSAKTSAVGHFLAIDPRGEFLYTGTQDPIRERLMIRGGPRNASISLQKTGRHATMMKYAIKSGDPVLAAANGNASINGTTLVISPDGTRIALPGAGGWESTTQNRRSYSIAIWNTKDMETMLGQVELGIFPHNIAFHPILNLGAADKGDTIVLFQGKSLAEVKSYKPPGGRLGAGVWTPLLLTFGGKGGKIIYAGGLPPGQRAQGGQPQQAPVLLHFLPLELTAEDQATLAKAYGKP